MHMLKSQKTILVLGAAVVVLLVILASCVKY